MYCKYCTIIIIITTTTPIMQGGDVDKQNEKYYSTLLIWEKMGFSYR